VKPVSRLDSLGGATLILRTHGIPFNLDSRLKSKKIDIVDATCPFVKRAQDIVKELGKKDCQILIFGDKTHPEVSGLVSYGQGKCRVIKNVSEIKGLNQKKKVYILSQTTQMPGNFKKIISYLRKAHSDVRVFNTICRSTITRQKEANNLAKKVDVLIVAGGKNSSNTKRLYEISKKSTKTYLVETADEIRAPWLRGAKKIGITAGASTPDWIIKDIENKIRSIII
jgi:4-hydroxy-3-methylbut-2-en-1-yl diphosphate reductase